MIPIFLKNREKLFENLKDHPHKEINLLAEENISYYESQILIEMKRDENDAIRY